MTALIIVNDILIDLNLLNVEPLMNAENFTSVGTNVWSTSLRGNSPKAFENQVTALIFVQLCGEPSAVATLVGHGLALAKVAQTTKVSCSKYAAEIHFYKQRAGLSFSLLKARYF